MATVTKGKTFISGETVEVDDIHQLVDSATVTNIVDADISASAAIVSTKLSTATQQALLPAGAVMAFAMNSAPAGWLAASGTAVSRSTYADLFSAIGTAHGAGDGSTTFNLPDLRGIFVRGSDSQTISGTSYSGTFATKQAESVNTASTLFRASSNHWAQGGSGVGIPMLYAGANVATYGTGSSYFGGAETRPANIALLYCIKF